jgi:hypothetical protein
MAKEKITIAGRAFDVPSRYSEGHVLTANEASALDQVFHENIRNNLSKKLDGKSDEEAQALVTEYAGAYVFGARTGGFISRDPVETEALNMCREAVRNAMKRKGYKLTGKDATPASKITELAKQLFDKDPEKWLGPARETVALKKQTQGASGDIEL